MIATSIGCFRSAAGADWREHPGLGDHPARANPIAREGEIVLFIARAGNSISSGSSCTFGDMGLQTRAFACGCGCGIGSPPTLPLKRADRRGSCFHLLRECHTQHLALALQVANVGERRELLGVVLPAGIERSDVLLEHSREQPDHVLAVFQDEPVLRMAPSRQELNALRVLARFSHCGRFTPLKSSHRQSDASATRQGSMIAGKSADATFGARIRAKLFVR